MATSKRNGNGTSVAKTNGKGKAVGKALDLNTMFEQDAGVGQETMGRDDYAIPRLNIVQPLSPVMQKKDPAYNKDAEMGSILETVTKTLYDGEDGIVVVPVGFSKNHNEWKPRGTKGGGGFVANHGSDASILSSCKQDDRGRFFNKEGNQIIPTAEYVVFIVQDDGQYLPAVISMSSTQLKKSKQWNMLINQFRLPSKDGGSFNPPMFARSYRLTTVIESNDKGTWAGWNIEPGDLLNDKKAIPNGAEIYAAAKAMREGIAQGKMRVVEPESNVSAHAEEVGQDVDDVPF